MRFLVLTDIHANLNALRAVFKKLDKLKPDIIISLGDQVNYGPYPRETLALLRDEKALLLMGNHEERLLCLKNNLRPDLYDYNWSLLRCTFHALPTESFIYPRELRFGRFFFTHNVPGDLFNIIEANEPKAFAAIAERLPEGVEAYFSGHNHLSWHVENSGIHFRNSGSTGCYEGKQGLVAGWHMIDDDGHVETRLAAYDPAGLKQAYISSGMSKEAPEFARLVMHQIETGNPRSFPHFISLAHQTGLQWNSKEAFRLAAEQFPWTSDLPTQAYWMKGES